MIRPFGFARTPKIIFGAGTFGEIPRIVSEYGKTALIVTGGKSFRSSSAWDTLTRALAGESVNHFPVAVESEPSPDLVDRAVAEYGDKGIEVVVACGGGSVIDAGKAISAMLSPGGSVLDYLEGVGTADHGGSKVPFVAVPTTSGTGSEATKNAVLSRVGPGGFKRSLRHDNFVPDVALVDPALTLSCPPHITAACGLDAFTQLLESYVSTNASPMTDALALGGIEMIGTCLMPACTDGSRDMSARAGMSCAALISGITLANAGLGVVHGLASTIGGRFDIPHGVVCGTLIGAATSATIAKLMNERGAEHPALRKYARAGFSLHGARGADVGRGCDMLVEKLNRWIETLQLPKLGAYGIREKDLDGIVSETGNKNNPVPLGKDEIREVLRMRTGEPL